MLANGKYGKCHLVHARRGSCPEWDRCEIPKLTVPGGVVPAMADSVLLLQVLLSGAAVNLRSIAEVIRGDIGLTIELLKRVSLSGESDEAVGISVAKNVVQAGIGTLLSLATETEPVSSQVHGRAALRQCEEFWAHARLAGLMAEELAYQAGGVDADEAYVAGLLFHMGELPSVLGRRSDFRGMKPCEIAGSLAEAWRLPALVKDVVGGEHLHPASASYPVLELVRRADQQATGIEGLVAEFARRAL